MLATVGGRAPETVINMKTQFCPTLYCKCFNKVSNQEKEVHPTSSRGIREGFQEAVTSKLRPNDKQVSPRFQLFFFLVRVREGEGYVVERRLE